MRQHLRRDIPAMPEGPRGSAKLRLVHAPTNEQLHSEAIATASSMLARRGAVMTLTVTDPLGNERVPGGAKFSVNGIYEVRATAHFRDRDLPPVTGRSQPVDGFRFITEPTASLNAHTEAVLDVVEQLRPHPSEWPS